MIGRALPLVLALGLLAGAKDDPLAGRIPGPPQRCMDTLASGTNPAIYDNRTIAYRQSSRRIWVTHPVGACPALRPLAVLIVERFGTQQCQNDQFRVVDPPGSIPSGICRFGPFVPYDKPAR